MLPTRAQSICLGLFVTLTLAAAAQPANPPTPALLTNVAQVRQLTSLQAARAFPVKLRGVMLAPADPRERAVMVADQTGGLYLLANGNLFAPFHRGDLLEVEGVSDPGQFAPIVRVTAARKLGTTTNPPPRAVTYHQLLTGALDAQWIELTGVVRRYIPPETGSDVWRILVASDGGVVSIRGTQPHNPELKEDSEVRVQAICLYQFNQKRQVLTPILQLPTGDAATVINPAPEQPFAAPVRSADSLLQFSAAGPIGHRVHVRGVVTHAQPGSLVWIRDASSGLRIQARQEENLQAGDELDVLGFPVYGSFSPVLEDAIFRKTGSTQPPAPLAITNAASAFDHEDDLVQLEALLTDVRPVLEGFAFTFAKDDTVFKAILKLPEHKREQSDWLPGSKLRITGICSLIHDDPRPMMGIWQPQSFQLLIRASTDLLVLSSPPWWTTKRLTYVLAAASASLLLATGMIVFVSRQRLKEQAHRRAMAEAEFTAILAERNRVAREIHDTLAQGLAATSVHLRLAKKQSATDTDSLNHHLDAAQQLVRESLEEARNSIWNMRSQVLETGDLSGALDGILRQMADGAEFQAALEVTGRARRFAPVIENNLLRVGQEAITNAARHARARQLKVTLDFGEKQFRLAVRDDGIGFDSARPPASSGGFGLVGMKERATELKGELRIQSTPGQGTEISLTVPLSGE